MLNKIIEDLKSEGIKFISTSFIDDERLEESLEKEFFVKEL